MTTSNLNTRQIEALTAAFSSARKSLAGAPLFLATVAVAAGMSTSDAHAWGTQYENIGRQLGNEVARNAAGGGYNPKANIAGLIGQTIGSAVARPFDQSAQERERIARIEAQERERAAREQAQARARAEAQSASRGGLVRYNNAVGNSQRASNAYQSIGNGLTFTNSQGQRVTQDEFESGNYPRQR